MAKTEIDDVFVWVNKDTNKIKRLIAAAVDSDIFHSIKINEIDQYIAKNKNHLNYLAFEGGEGTINCRHYKPTEKIMTEEEFYQWLKDLKED